MAQLNPPPTARQFQTAAQFKALLRLRGILTWRRFTAQTGRIIGVLLGILFILPIAIGIGVGTWFGYTHLPDAWPTQLLGIILVGVWLAWLVFPLVLAPLNEGIDLQRLLVYPLQRRDLIVSAILGSVFDYQTYFLLPIFVAMIAAFGRDNLLLIPYFLLVLPLFFALCIVTSQFMLTALGGILQSRRFRDVAIVLLSLSGLSCWAFSQFAQTGFLRFAENIDPDQIRNLRPLDTLRWLPPGAFAQSLADAISGNWAATLLWLAYGVGFLLILGWLWSVLLHRLLTGEGFLINFAPREEKQRVRGDRRDWGWTDRLISAETRLIATKELQAMWRVPQRRIATLQLLIMPLLAGAVPLWQSGALQSNNFEQNAVLVLPLYTLFFLWFSAQNMLGWEHKGLPTLLLTPVDRTKIFRGKSLTIGIFVFVPIGLITLILYVRRPAILIIVALLSALLIALITLTVASFFSAIAPYPVKLDFKGSRNFNTSGGCGAMLINFMVAPLIVAILAIPILAPLGILRFLSDYAWVAYLLIAFDLIYAPSFFLWGTRYAGKRLLQREPEVLEAARPVDDD